MYLSSVEKLSWQWGALQYGLINKVITTPANVLDFQVLINICPDAGMVFADKLYDCKHTYETLQLYNCFPAIIQKRNSKRKNRNLDKWRSSVRMPFEGVFAKVKKRARYRRLTKVHFQVIAESIVHNLKKATMIIPTMTQSPPLN